MGWCHDINNKNFIINCLKLKSIKHEKLLGKIKSTIFDTNINTKVIVGKGR